MICIPENPVALVGLFLLIVNAILVIAYKTNNDYKEKEYKRLKAEKDIALEEEDNDPISILYIDLDGSQV